MLAGAPRAEDPSQPIGEHTRRHLRVMRLAEMGDEAVSLFRRVRVSREAKPA